jgi:hypothetical protein
VLKLKQYDLRVDMISGPTLQLPVE